MDKNTVYKLAKFISNTRYPLEKVKKSWPEFLRMIGVSHPEALTAIQDLLDQRGEDLGLNYDELIRLALFFNNRHLKQLIYSRKLPPTVQDQHPELMSNEEIEEAGAPAAAQGTAFTSTQNTAPYPIPLGTLRRDWWKSRKKRKKKK